MGDESASPAATLIVGPYLTKIMARPPLPYYHANPCLKKLTPANMPPVKYQILTCQGKDILVGRLKMETPTEHGHAFILRRFDTNALSLTTMFRAAFPSSTDAEERAEVAWVKDNFDLSGNNGSSRDPNITRLAGIWVNTEVALELAEAYDMLDLIKLMIEAKPDPNGNYRRSNKSAAAAGAQTTPGPTTNAPAVADHAPFSSYTAQLNASAIRVNGSPAKPASASPQKPASKSLPTPSPTSGGSNPPAAKRRKEASPAPAPIPVPPSPTLLPRRSTRTKSPAPRGAPQPLTSVIKPKPSRSSVPPSPKKRAAELPKAPSPVKAAEDVLVEEHVAGTELYEQDVSEQKQLIADLKAAAAAKNDQEDVEDRMEEDESEGPSKLKRAREEAEQPLKFEFKEPEVEERQIATNNRVGRFHLQPRTKSLAWGLAAFAVGMSAVSFLPNFF